MISKCWSVHPVKAWDSGVNGKSIGKNGASSLVSMKIIP